MPSAPLSPPLQPGGGVGLGERRIKRVWKPLRENDPRRLAWDGLIAAIAMITLVLLPLDLLRAAHTGQAIRGCWIGFDLIGLTDMLLNTKTSFERDGIIVRVRPTLIRAYLRGMAAVDLLANLPALIASLLALQFLANRWERLNLFDIRLLRIGRYAFSTLIVTSCSAALSLKACAIRSHGSRPCSSRSRWSNRSAIRPCCWRVSLSESCFSQPLAVTAKNVDSCSGHDSGATLLLLFGARVLTARVHRSADIHDPLGSAAQRPLQRLIRPRPISPHRLPEPDLRSQPRAEWMGV